MRSFILCVLLLSLSSCGVPRQRHASTLRELEIAKGRLADQKRFGQKAQSELEEKFKEIQSASVDSDRKIKKMEIENKQVTQQLKTFQNSLQVFALEEEVFSQNLQIDLATVSGMRFAFSKIFDLSQGNLSLQTKGEEFLKEVSLLLQKSQGKIAIIAYEDPEQREIAPLSVQKTAEILMKNGVERTRVSLHIFTNSQTNCQTPVGRACPERKNQIEILLFPNTP